MTSTPIPPDEGAAVIDPASWAVREVPLDGVTYRYWESGSGTPLIVLHGGGGPDLAPAYAALGDGARVCCLELPGFCDTPAVPGLATHRDLAHLVLNVLDEAGFESFALLGVSFGGAVAAWIATIAPERIERLVLVAPAALRFGEPMPEPSSEPVETILRAHPERGGPAPASPELMDQHVAFVRRIWSGSSDDQLREGLTGLDVPTLIVFGALDRLMPPETGREYRRLLPRSTLVFVYDAAHEVAWDRPEAFTDLVGDFLRRGDAHVVVRTSRMINP